MALFRSHRSVPAYVPPSNVPSWMYVASFLLGLALVSVFSACLVWEYRISMHEHTHPGHITLLVIGDIFGVFFALPRVAFPVVQQVIVYGRETNISVFRRKSDSEQSREYLKRRTDEHDAAQDAKEPEGKR